jgi:hypothetical protein
MEARPKKSRRPRWLQGWRGALLAMAVLLVLYVAYSLFVSLSNGRLVELELVAKTGEDGAMQLLCGAGANPSVCAPGTSNFTVQARDRVHVVLVAEGNLTSVSLEGAPYWLWPAGLSMSPSSPEESFTAWAKGTFEIRCSAEGEPGRACATLVVV